ncbi:MAG: class D sortase [Acidobacteria bacterium]|nr:class D sortase [Acidobacteriota bacterium]
MSSIFGQREAAEEWHKPVQSRQPAPQTPDLGVALAKLSIPRLNAAWFVFEGVGKKELRLGPGHMRGSALPGTSGNCVIAGHRDTHFRALKDIRKGDEIVVETRQGRFRYRVTDLEIVKPTNTKALAPTTSPVMNLITCYPFYYLGSAPKRFVVHAQMEPLEVAHSGAPPS